ncbi:MAG: FAD-dependent oxidoreductase [bacterium]|jgi:hypothetical protein|nr:FAD-dependent oxidoreductase [bacterium]
MTSIRTDVAIAGGGLAGMSLALDLARAGRRVALMERRAGLGGAVHTMPGGVDNSVHLMLAACSRCLARLEELGSRHLLVELDPWAVVQDGHRRLRLPMGAPLRVMPAAARSLGIGRTLGLLGNLALLMGHQARPGERAAQVLARSGVRAGGGAERFWREWALSIFNAPTELVDGALFLRTMRLLFANPRLQRPFAAAHTLEELWIGPFRRRLDEQGVRLLTGCPLRAVVRDAHRVLAFVGPGHRVEADHFVWAGPPDGLRTVDGLADVAPAMPPRSEGRHIVNFRLAARGRFASGGLMGWFGRPFQWIFPGPGGEVVLVGSGWTDEDLAHRARMEQLVPELLASHGFDSLGGGRWVVQRHATPMPTPAFEAARPGPRSSLVNVWWSGAWLDTGLPQSMESALAGAELTFRILQDK